jgi:hypothetical protein
MIETTCPMCSENCRMCSRVMTNKGPLFGCKPCVRECREAMDRRQVREEQAANDRDRRPPTWQ